MADLSDLFLLLGFAGVIGSWLKLSRAREIAVAEARRQCARHQLQLLDETVGLRAIRLRRGSGTPALERCYAFEVSIHGDDRQPAQVWMIGDRLSAIRLPESHRVDEPPRDDSPGNIVPLRRTDRSSLH